MGKRSVTFWALLLLGAIHAQPIGAQEDEHPRLSTELTWSVQAFNLDGSRKRFFQYDVPPGGLVLKRLTLIDDAPEAPFWLNLHRVGEATSSGTFLYGQTPAGRTLRTSFGQSGFYPDAVGPRAGREEHQATLRWPLARTPGLHVGFRQQNVSAVRLHTLIETQVTDFHASTVVLTRPLEVVTTLSLRSWDDASAPRNHVQARRALVEVTPRRTGERDWWARVSQTNARSSSRDANDGPLAQRIRTTSAGMGWSGPASRDLWWEAQYHLHRVDRETPTLIAPQRRPIHAQSVIRGTMRLTYTGLDRTRVEAGLRHDQVERMASDGTATTPSFTTLWLDAQTRAVPPWTLSAGYRRRTLHEAPSAQLTDPRPLHARDYTHTRLKCSGNLTRKTSAEVEFTQEKETNPWRGLDLKRTRGALNVSSVLSSRSVVTGGYFRENWSSRSAQVAGFLSDVEAFTASASYTLDDRTWLSSSYSSWRTKGRTSVRDGVFTLSVQHRVREDLDLTANLRLESTEDFVRVVPNSYAANTFEVEITAKL